MHEARKQRICPVERWVKQRPVETFFQVLQRVLSLKPRIHCAMDKDKIGNAAIRGPASCHRHELPDTVNNQMIKTQDVALQPTW
jgi:hypothetical protein